MAKTAGNTYEWKEHNLTLFGKGGFRIRAGNTFNLLGGELPLNQAIALFIEGTQTPISVIDDVAKPLDVRLLYDYSVAPLKRHFDHTKILRTSGSGVQDVLISGIYTGSSAKTYKFKIVATGSPDTFQYKTSTDGGAIFGNYSSAIDITGVSQPLQDGLTIHFSNITGHTANDEWEFTTAMPQLVEAAVQTTVAGDAEVLTAAINTKTTLLNAAVAASTSGTTGFTITVDTGHGLVANDVIAVEDEQMLVTATSGSNDVNVTRGYNGTTAAAHVDNSNVVGLVTASHRQVFVVKIMTGSSGKFVYSTDGGVTFDNGGGSVEAAADDGDGYLTIPADPFTHVLRDSDNVSYGIKVTFTGITDYSNNDAFSFHAFPTTKYSVYATSSTKSLIAWVENVNKAKLKLQFLSGASLGTAATLDLPATFVMNDTGITLSSQEDAAVGARIKFTESGIVGYTSDSTSDTTYKWFELNKDGGFGADSVSGYVAAAPALFMGKPASSGGTPAGMQPGIALQNGSLFLKAANSSATTGHASGIIVFDANSGAGINSRILQYDGVVTSASIYDGLYGFKGLWVGGYTASDNLILTGTNVYPWQSGTYTAAALTSDSGGAGGTTLTDASAGANFNAGMIGRPITRTTDGTAGIITAFTSSSQVTTSGITNWASGGGENYKLLKPANTYTNSFGRIGNGVSTAAEYSTTNKATIHQLFHNIAAHVFEGQTLRLWAKESDGWSTYMSADSNNVGHCLELGLGYNASGGYSYKINFPNTDTAPSVGDVLEIASITTSDTNVDGTKDKPYRIQLEWDTVAGRSNIDIMTDAFIYG